MNFIYEELNEEDKKFFNSFGFRDPLSKYTLAYTPSDWIADKNAKLFLVSLGGQGYKFDLEFPPTYFYLIWDKKLIKLETYNKASGDWTIGIRSTWMITSIVAPENLKTDEKLLIDTIREAFEIYERGRNKKLLAVEFIEIASPCFVKLDVEYN